MPDIALRFNKDMLVLSAPVDALLVRQGVDIERDRELISLIEPEAVYNAYRVEASAGAQCLVTNTAGITRARLAHANMENRAEELAAAALTIANKVKPQHIFAEIGPTGLPLDVSSKQSLIQNRDQYAQAATAFGDKGFDAYFLNGMTSADDMQCALMGVRKESDIPLIASVKIEEGSTPRGEELLETFTMMLEYGAQVLGFETDAPLDCVLRHIESLAPLGGAPLLVQLHVRENNPKQQEPTESNPYFCPDTFVEAAVRLRAAGVQFLRACGNTTSAYTGALVAASAGFDVVQEKVSE